MARSMLIWVLLSLVSVGCGSKGVPVAEEDTSGFRGADVIVQADAATNGSQDTTTHEIISDVSSEPDAPERVVEEEDVPTIPPGSISGRIVNSEGEGLVGIKMLSCTTSLCVSGETGENGAYNFEGLDPEPQKMQCTDATGAYMSVLFFQEVISGSHGELSRDVIMPLRTTEVVAWPEGQEGEILLAEGALSIQVASEALDYPLGFFDENLRAEMVPGDQLPPFDVEPWAGKEEGVFAFYLYPLHVISEPYAAVQVLQGIDAPDGSQFTIWSVDPDTSRLESVGTAAVDDKGALKSDPDAALKNLSVLVFIPAE